MSVKLRLHRIGKKKKPFYRIVAIDSRQTRDGAYLDKIGHYNPITQPAQLVIDRDKAFKWLADGAIPTDAVKSLLRQEGIILEWDLRKRGVAEEQIAAELSKFRELQLQRQKRLEAKAAMAKRKSEKAEAKEAAAAADATPAAKGDAPSAEAKEKEAAESTANPADAQ